MSLLSREKTMQILRWVVCACFAYVTVLPVGNNGVLIPVLGVFGLSALALAITGRRGLARELCVVFAGVGLVGAYGTLLGLGNPGVVNGALVWLVAPALFGLVVWASDLRLLRMLLMTSAWTTILVSVFIAVFVLGELHWLPQLLPPALREATNAGFDHGAVGYTAITFYGVSTFAGSAPLWLTAALLPRHALLPGRVTTICAGVLGLVGTVLAGRTAITLIVVTVPIGAWVVWRVLSRKLRRSLIQRVLPGALIVVAGIVFAALAIAGNRSVSIAVERLISLFTGEGRSADDAIRVRQAEELLRGWAESPVFGHGFGAIIPGYERSVERPWNFELQYHLLLFQVGILGTALAVAAVGAAAYAVYRAYVVRPSTLPVLLITVAGATGMLIANASNPYLQAPGNMWAIFVPLMLANAVLANSADGDLGVRSERQDPAASTGS